MFEGSCVALVTPFKDGLVDDKKLAELVEFQIAGGTSAGETQKAADKVATIFPTAAEDYREAISRLTDPALDPTAEETVEARAALARGG